MKFKVLWKKIFLATFKYMIVLITCYLAASEIISFISSGFQQNTALSRGDTDELLLLGFLLLTFISAGSFVIAMLAARSCINIENGIIYGRNYWGFKSSFPLQESLDWKWHSAYAIDYLIIHSKQKKEICIYGDTENLEQLLDIIEPHMIKNGDTE